MMTKLERAAAEMNIKEWSDVNDLADAQITIHNRAGDEEGLDFPEAIEKRDGLKEGIDWMEKQLKEINDQLLVVARASEIQKVSLWGGMTFELRNGRSAAKIIATRLLEHGVSLETIQESTEEGTPYQYVQVNKPRHEQRKA